MDAKKKARVNESMYVLRNVVTGRGLRDSDGHLWRMSRSLAHATRRDIRS